MSEQVPRVFTTEFKERAVLRLEAGASASALAAELGVRRKLLYDWRQAYREHGVAGLNRELRCQFTKLGQLLCRRQSRPFSR